MVRLFFFPYHFLFYRLLRIIRNFRERPEQLREKQKRLMVTTEKKTRSENCRIRKCILFNAIQAYRRVCYR